MLLLKIKTWLRPAGAPPQVPTSDGAPAVRTLQLYITLKGLSAMGREEDRQYVEWAERVTDAWRVHEENRTDYVVYALSDPRTNEVRYVGCTSDLKSRYSAHLMINQEKNVVKKAWIGELKSLGLRPLVVTLEDGYNKKTAHDREACWIARYLTEGAPLVNKVAPFRGWYLYECDQQSAG
jgi:predicted GIY-YIG superfamily endonuclease